MTWGGRSGWVPIRGEGAPDHTTGSTREGPSGWWALESWVKQQWGPGDERGHPRAWSHVGSRRGPWRVGGSSPVARSLSKHKLLRGLHGT